MEALKAESETIQAENVSLKQEQGLRVKDDIFSAVTEGLTDFERDKLKALSEGLIFITNEDYTEKLTDMKEAFKSNKKKEESEDEEDKDKKDPKAKSDDDEKQKKLGESVSMMFGPRTQL